MVDGSAIIELWKFTQFFTQAEPMSTILPPTQLPRTCCAKCGSKLHGAPDTNIGPRGYCVTCRHLLKFGDQQEYLDLPIELQQKAGCWPPYEARQALEPIPFVPLDVQNWPEIRDREPRGSSVSPSEVDAMLDVYSRN